MNGGTCCCAIIGNESGSSVDSSRCPIHQSAEAVSPSPTLEPRLGAPPSPERIEKALREEWWLNHGCPISAVYGDDGEMQCNAVGCITDFKRMPLLKLEHKVMLLRIVCEIAYVIGYQSEEIEAILLREFADASSLGGDGQLTEDGEDK